MKGRPVTARLPSGPADLVGFLDEIVAKRLVVDVYPVAAGAGSTPLVLVAGDEEVASDHLFYVGQYYDVAILRSCGYLGPPSNRRLGNGPDSSIFFSCVSTTSPTISSCITYGIPCLSAVLSTRCLLVGLGVSSPPV